MNSFSIWYESWLSLIAWSPGYLVDVLTGERNTKIVLKKNIELFLVFGSLGFGFLVLLEHFGRICVADF